MNIGKNAALAPLDFTKNGYHGHGKQKQKKKHPPSGDPISMPSIEIQE